ncbi:MAG TPA: hypothetical protein DEG71_00530, partial [Clostridiales bacterium]|nr:hypothetical protein [Clostridiales bacterium]
PNNCMQTTLIIKMGPQLLQKLTSFSASIREIAFLSYKSEVSLAPIGYPQNIPSMTGMAPTPEILNKACIIPEKIVCTMVNINLLSSIKLVMTIKGNNDGIILLYQNTNPNLHALKTFVG